MPVNLAFFNDDTASFMSPKVSDTAFAKAVSRVAPNYASRPGGLQAAIEDYLRKHGPAYSMDLIRLHFGYDAGKGPANSEWSTIFRFMVQQRGLRKFAKQRGHRDGNPNRIAYALPNQIP